jgi:hypothetical protein
MAAHGLAIRAERQEHAENAAAAGAGRLGDPSQWMAAAQAGSGRLGDSDPNQWMARRSRTRTAGRSGDC